MTIPDYIEPTNLYFAFDGLDGCGKSSAVTYFGDYIKKQYNQTFFHTREIGGTDLAEDIRQIVLRRPSADTDPVTDLLLIEAARNEQRRFVADFVEYNPFTAVISDRCEASTYAYQVSAGKVSEKLFFQLEELHLIKPSVYVYLKTTPEVAFLRMQKRGVSDKFENKNLDFFKDAAFGYDEYFQMIEDQGKEVVALYCDGPIEETYFQVAEFADRIVF